MRMRASIILGAVLATGCVNLAPDHARPVLSTEPAYDPEVRPDGSIAASTLAWQDYFADPRLDALIAAALTNNRDLVAATARIEQARAQYRINEAQRLPTLGAQGSAVRSRVPLGAGGSGIGTGVPTVPVDPSLPDGGSGADVPGSATFNRFDVGVGITSFEIDFWGRLRNLAEAARAEFLATIAAQRAFYLSLIGDVASVYFELVETEEQIALAEATVRSREEGLRIARLRLEGGVTSALDFRQAETLLTQAQQQLSVQRLTAVNLRNQLTVLVGGRIPETLPPGLNLQQQAVLASLDGGLPSDLLLTRPDIIAAEERLRAAGANIGAARAAFFPNISLTGSAGFASSDLGGLFGGDSFTWSFGPSINLPIFDWGAREANVDFARARQDELVANYDTAVQNAFREVSDALAGRRYLAEQVETVVRGVEAQERIARLARLRYREGVANYLEVLDAERNLFTARQGLLEARRLQLQNLGTLYVALGGGTALPQSGTASLPAPPPGSVQ
jgi:outer membrane protein, multidrug efflux system